MDEWRFELDQLMAPVSVKHQSRKDERIDRVRALIERRKVVTVGIVSKELGIPDMTVRRILGGLTPGYAREVCGWPKKWRIARRRGLDSIRP